MMRDELVWDKHIYGAKLMMMVIWSVLGVAEWWIYNIIAWCIHLLSHSIHPEYPDQRVLYMVDNMQALDIDIIECYTPAAFSVVHYNCQYNPCLSHLHTITSYTFSLHHSYTTCPTIMCTCVCLHMYIPCYPISPQSTLSMSNYIPLPLLCVRLFCQPLAVQSNGSIEDRMIGRLMQDITMAVYSPMGNVQQRIYSIQWM